MRATTPRRILLAAVAATSVVAVTGCRSADGTDTQPPDSPITEEDLQQLEDGLDEIDQLVDDVEGLLEQSLPDE